MNYTYEQLESRYKILPEDIKEAMTAVDTADTISSIGKKHSLHFDQIGDIAEEVGLTMLGLTKPQEFSANLQQKLPAVEAPTIQAITEDIDTLVFAKVRESLKAIHEQHENLPAAAGGTSNGKNLFDQKMANLFNLPKQEIKIQDPYREPMEDRL